MQDNEETPLSYNSRELKSVLDTMVVDAEYGVNRILFRQRLDKLIASVFADGQKWGK